MAGDMGVITVMEQDAKPGKKARHDWNLKDNDKATGQLIGRLTGTKAAETGV